MEENNTIKLKNFEETIHPAFESNNIAVGLFSSDEYAPYCGILIQSLIKNSTQDNNYDILILERNICDDNKKSICSLVENYSNISIRFLNVVELSMMLNIVPRGHFTLDNAIKIFFISNIFSEYKKIVSTDSDLVFERDVADLFKIEMNDCYIAAVSDIIMQTLIRKGQKASGEYNGLDSKEYIQDILGLKEVDKYLNTGVCVFNIEQCRNDEKFFELLNDVNNYNYWFLEQDALNKCLKKKVVELDIRWNIMASADFSLIEKYLGIDVVKKYEYASKNAFIYHYPGIHKPWKSDKVPYAEMFYKYARVTPWYESILFDIVQLKINNTIRCSKIANQVQALNSRVDKIENGFKKKFFIKIKTYMMPLVNIILPKGSRRRERLKLIINRLADKQLRLARKAMLDRILINKKLSRFSETWQYHNMNKLKQLKNMGKGKRCFVVATGPSLKVDDLEKLKGEITFSLNSIYKLFELTDWRPTYYLNNDIALNYKMRISQEIRYNNFLELINKYSLDNIMISTSKYDDTLYNTIGDKLFILPTIDYLYMYMQPEYPQWSKDCSENIYAFGTSVYLLMQLIAYMGFEKVYLLGADCNYTGNQKHGYDDETDKLLYSNYQVAKSLEDALVRGFEAIKLNVDKGNCPVVYNATRGGKLEVFPRVSFDTLFKKGDLI